jgi:hypothetical protein
VVQTFPTSEACLKVREQMLQQVAAAEGPVQQVVQARNPAWYVWISTMFVCEPRPDTTEEQVR